MVNVYKDYKIDSDDNQYTLYKETVVKENGKTKKTKRPLGYFSSFWRAVKQIIRLEISREISENEMDLAEAVRRIEEKHNEFERLLLNKTNGE